MAFIPVNAQLQEYFGCSNQVKGIGAFSKYLKDSSWWVNDRLINMPPQLVPNLTKLVLEQSIIAQKFIIYYCKMGRYVESPLEEVKRAKKIKMESVEFYFQPEDEIIAKYALDKQDVEFDQQSMSSDAKRTFHEQGFVPFRRILILENNLDKVLEELTSFLQV
jgi:protein BCP1